MGCQCYLVKVNKQTNKKKQTWNTRTKRGYFKILIDSLPLDYKFCNLQIFDIKYINSVMLKMTDYELYRIKIKQATNSLMVA